MSETKTGSLVKAIYVVPSVYLNWNVVEDGKITDEVEFMRLAMSVGDVFPNIKVFQQRFNDGDYDDGDFILIK